MNYLGLCLSKDDLQKGVAMGLSEREQKLLDELERGLYASDANLAHKLGKSGSKSPKLVIAGLSLAVIGLSLLVVAVTLQFALFGVAGFLTMLAGLIVATSSGKGTSVSGPTAPKAGNPKASNAPKKNFFDDRWDKRQGS